MPVSTLLAVKSGAQRKEYFSLQSHNLHFPSPHFSQGKQQILAKVILKMLPFTFLINYPRSPYTCGCRVTAPLSFSKVFQFR